MGKRADSKRGPLPGPSIGRLMSKWRTKGVSRQSVANVGVGHCRQMGIHVGYVIKGMGARRAFSPISQPLCLPSLPLPLLLPYLFFPSLSLCPLLSLISTFPLLLFSHASKTLSTLTTYTLSLSSVVIPQYMGRKGGKVQHDV